MTPQSDEDEVWRQIVASFNQTAEPTSAVQPWPERENVPAEDPPQPVKAEAEAPARLHEEDPDTEEREAPVAEEDDHYVPPPPPPLPKMDSGTRVAWLALFGGPAYLLLAALLSWPMDGWIVFAAIAAFIGGFVALIVRMGDGPPPGSGWDDGAVI
ncbi:hypothetical protein [Sphaerisporangium sp. TRM90804]|uniref:hypothetical protein n=1 Tax=Sphaerisporangium sp. TRM90804 TaxID=3031113 RepID=UPI002447C4CC|nr:hypothetical protein [Sphaerisporangium sp. TRM90804]MDH2424543.1 hypothetical protein [Sphaerisporangium sp. TRM90804]